MMRSAAVIAAFILSAAPAHAATSATENGVRVWRAAQTAAVDAPSLKGAAAPCKKTTVIVRVETRWPLRRLRTHGFWSGDPLSWERRLPLTTSGFFADRMAAGL